MISTSDVQLILKTVLGGMIVMSIALAVVEIWQSNESEEDESGKVD